ncbi:sensor histidine kinase [Streptomyces sp. URMC 123]|uniref:sensor histidine kinase n=1 Tax=Streptomyces sp. URMC 123 TaxID=3423403 RepID=UPI003F1D0478
MKPAPQAPPPEGLLKVATRNVRATAHALSHPSHPPTPPRNGSSRRRLRHLPYILVFVLTAILLPVTIGVLTNTYGLNGGLASALAVAQVAPLLMAVNRPLQAWWIMLPANVIGALLLWAGTAELAHPWPWPAPTVNGYLALMLALGLRETRRTLLGAWLVTGLASMLLEGFADAHRQSTSALLFVLSGLMLLIGGAIRERGEAQRRLTEQETISEAERARRTLLEERARIARELHDVVAHHMSVITVQSDSAPYRIEGLPEAAREEFAAIASTARESLSEMRRLLGVLRSEGTDGERAPQPGLDRLPQLVEATVRAGVPAELSMGRDVLEVPVPQAVDLSAYRIVQEALANVVRHAPGAATRVSARVDHGGGGAGEGTGVLTVSVVNEAADRPDAPLESTGTGHGLVGMRERVRLVGGELEIGPRPEGGFRVVARLPLAPSPAPPGEVGTARETTDRTDTGPA